MEWLVGVSFAQAMSIFHGAWVPTVEAEKQHFERVYGVRSMECDVLGMYDVRSSHFDAIRQPPHAKR